MKLVFIGIGKVGFALANNFQKKGHSIVIAHEDPKSKSVVSALARNPEMEVQPLQSAIDGADVIFLAIPFDLNQHVLFGLRFGGKVLVDCTNPVGPGITHGLQSRLSGSEQVQRWAEDARVVKSYSIYGFENFEHPTFPAYGVKPIMPIAGDDVPAKQSVAKLNFDLGFDTLDVGGLSQALHLEHMTLLWVSMVRAGGHHPHFAWAYLER